MKYMFDFKVSDKDCEEHWGYIFLDGITFEARNDEEAKKVANSYNKEVCGGDVPNILDHVYHVDERGESWKIV